MRTKLLLKGLIFLATVICNTQARVGDPGVTFDQSIIDDNKSCYPQMERWSKAGVEGGIPFLTDFDKRETINPGNSDAINAAINKMARSLSGNQKGLITLKNGNYSINKSVKMKSRVSLIGETREGVKCNISMTGGEGILFDDVTFSGLYNMTVEGTWGKPKYNWNYSLSANDELPRNDNISIKISDGKNCWVDKVTIINCARDPIRVDSAHNTLRDLYVDGAHKKAGGAQGYFFILQGDNLITGCYATHLRHISLQGDDVEYNVVYDNNFEQEVSFHNDDDGNNLIENNRITLPVDMPPVARGDADDVTPSEARNNKPIYFAIMGPWASFHRPSEKPNYIINNTCKQFNHDFGSNTPWSEPGLVYKGPLRTGSKPDHHINNFPLASANCRSPRGKTLYPIKLNCTQGTPCNDGDECTINDVLDINCNCVGEDSNQDSDNDNVCDAADKCPDFDDNLIGKPCDDGNECTINDVYTERCLCEGTTNTIIEISPVDDAYLQSGTLFNNDVLRIEEGSRVSYLKFDLTKITQNIKSASLNLTVSGDSGSGIINIYKSDDINWTERNLSTNNAPGTDVLVGNYTGNYEIGNSYSANLSTINDPNIFSLVLVHQGGNDVSFGSKSSNDAKPKLLVSVESCSLSTNDVGKPFDFSVYPNPADNILHFNINSINTHDNLELNIVDTLGRKLYSNTLNDKLNDGKVSSSIDVSHLSVGVYFMILKHNNSKDVLRVVIDR